MDRKIFGQKDYGQENIEGLFRAVNFPVINFPVECYLRLDVEARLNGVQNSKRPIEGRKMKGRKISCEQDHSKDFSAYNFSAN